MLPAHDALPDLLHCSAITGPVWAVWRLLQYRLRTCSASECKRYYAPRADAEFQHLPQVSRCSSAPDSLPGALLGSWGG